MNKFKFVIEDLPNGNYFVSVYRNDNITIQRAYPDLRDVISLIPIVFEPRHKLRNFQETGKDPEGKNNRD